MSVHKRKYRSGIVWYYSFDLPTSGRQDRRRGGVAGVPFPSRWGCRRVIPSFRDLVGYEPPVAARLLWGAFRRLDFNPTQR